MCSWKMTLKHGRTKMRIPFIDDWMMDGWMDGCMDRWMMDDGLMDGWMDGWMYDG